MKKLLPVLLLLLTSLGYAQKSRLIIGTYTSGNSKGIYVYDFNSNNGSSQLVSSIASSNPSFVAVSPDKKYVYAVNEDADSVNNGGAVSAYALDAKKGTLRFINQQKSGGNHPCYVTVDKTNKWVIAGNYTGGSFSVLPIGKNGAVGKYSTLVQHEGSSVNKERQEKAHVHQTLLTADNKFILVPDLGMDKLLVYAFNSASGKVKKNETGSANVNAGYGPRHVAIHPNQQYVYLTEELSGTVAAFRFSPGGQLKMLQTISTLPENYTGSFSGADIHISADGRFLYSSNRGDLNDIAIFSINSKTGILTLVGHQSTLGSKPRNFNFDPTGKFLLVANQDSNNVIVFSIDPKTGLLTDTGKRIEVPNPVCLQWVK